MVLWRDRGIVLDSDDDDEVQDLEFAASSPQDDTDVPLHLGNTGLQRQGLPKSASRQASSPDDATATQAAQRSQVSRSGSSLQITAAADPRSIFDIPSSQESVPGGTATGSQPRRTHKAPSRLPAGIVLDTQSRREVSSQDLLTPRTPARSSTEFAQDGHSVAAISHASHLLPENIHSSPPHQSLHSSSSSVNARLSPRQSQLSPAAYASSSLLSELPTSQSSISLQETKEPTPLPESRASDNVSHHFDPELVRELQHGRRFRARNPVQLHPYAFDEQQYHQSLNGTGYRPVRVIDKSPRRTSKVANAETGGNDTFVSAPGESSPIPSSLLPLELSNDFPDLSFLERESLSGELREGFKRRRLLESHHGDEQAAGRQSVETTAEQANRIRRKFRRKEFRLPEALLPRSHEANVAEGLSPDELDSDLPDLAFSRSAIATPSVSHQDQILHLSPDYSSDSDIGPVSARRNRRLARPIAVDHDSQGEDSHFDHDAPIKQIAPTVNARDMERARKRIKGVLPASWLRIDQARKEPVRAASTASLSPTKLARRNQSHQRSISLSTSPKKKLPQNTSATIQLYDSELENSETATPPVILEEDDSQSLDNSHAYIVFQDEGDYGDIQENDWIDDMRSGPSRQAHKPRRKRQSRLPDMLGRKTIKANRSANPTERTLSHRRSASSGTQVARSTANNRFRPPRLSILDAPVSEDEQQLPNFLRIARRKAKSKPGKGRHSPGAKHISFHSRDEGLEAEMVLRDWKAAKIRPSAEHKSERVRNKQRQVLGERPPNPVDPAAHPLLTRSKVPDRPVTSLNTRTHTCKVKVRQSRLHYPSLSEEQDLQENQDPNNMQQPVEKRPAATSKSARVKQLFSRPVAHLRPGMLEELQATHDTANRRFAFQRDLQSLGGPRGAKSSFAPERDGMLERYLWEDNDSPAHAEDPAPEDASTNTNTHSGKSSKITRQKRLRKRPPQQLQIESYEPHQISDNYGDEEETQVIDVLGAYDEGLPQRTNVFPNPSIKAMQGLLPTSTAYSVDFGISPLPVGVCFHQSTFLGSGELSKACALAERDFSAPGGFQLVQLHSKTYHLGIWTQEAMTDVQTIFQHIQASLQTSIDLTSQIGPKLQASDLLRSVVIWVSKKLSFLDAIDLRSCLSSLLGLIEGLLDVTNTQAKDKSFKPTTPLYWLYLTTFAAQLVQLSHIQPARDDLKDRSQHAFKKCARQSLTALINNHATEIRTFHESWRLRSIAGSSIRDIDAIESLVGMMLLMQKFSAASNDFWTVLQHSLSDAIPPNSCDIQDYEQQWHTLFAVLPFCEFDEQGIHQRARRCENASGSWKFVDFSLGRIFELYNITPNATAANPYLRILLSRCYRLIKTWWWQKWDPSLKMMYDFFAQRGFALLANEESRGCTRFLEHLDVEQEPKLESNDRSFQIFLKTLAVGFIRLCDSMTEKKIVNIAWRFIPNHGRTHKKEDALQQEDLDALQNQHELLCVLYYTTPPPARPRLQLIRGLVDLKLSHLEICRLNIRAWANLTRFEVSSGDSSGLMRPLVDWVNNALDQLIQLHAGAKAEAESFTSNNTLTHASEISSVVRSNQRQIEALLSTILNCLADILKTARNEAAAACLYHGVSMSIIFGMYVQGTSHLDALMFEAMGVYQAQASRRLNLTSATNAAEASEESQDYGDFPSIEDLDGHVQHEQKTGGLDDEIPLRALQNFISNCFGSGVLNNDTFLEHLVDAYVQVSHAQVKNGHRDWADFLEEHGSKAWSNFPSTETSSRFKVYFLAKIVQSDQAAFKENALIVFSTWIVSLSERESMLKYQHVLTNSMLNSWPDHPLLWNLPFTSRLNPLKHSSRQYELTLQELRGRRLGLISSILENMRRQTFMRSEQAAGAQASKEILSMCRQLLQIFQDSLKRTYEDTVSGSSTRGAYVIFVQQVVSLLQQYTTGIVPVDRYFTDGSTAFPLPADDPTYLVGRLKSYTPKLQDSKTQKQLAAFVLNAFARAAADSQSEYLIDQITRSVADQFEAAGTLTLRRLLVQKIFPAYERMAMETQCGWIVALPIFDILQSIFASLMSSTDLASQTSMEPSLDMINATLNALASAFTSNYTSAEGQDLPAHSSQRMCHLIIAALRVTSAALPMLAYAHRVTPDSHVVASTLEVVKRLQKSAQFCGEGKHLAGPRMQLDRDAHPNLSHQTHDQLTQYVAQDLQDTLNREWSCHKLPGEAREHYYVTRGRSQREVAMPALPADLAELISSFNEAERGYAAAISQASKQFDADVEQAFCGGDGQRRRCNGCADIDV